MTAHGKYSDVLTPAETEILQLMAHGLSNKEIARVRSCTLMCIKAHIHTLFTKLRVHNRTQAALWAWRNGVVTIDEAWQTVSIQRELRRKLCNS